MKLRWNAFEYGRRSQQVAEAGSVAAADWRNLFPTQAKKRLEWATRQYVILFRVMGEVVRIERVVYGGRDLLALFNLE